MLRLSPLFPFGILSYTLGCTTVALGEYTIGTTIGLLPSVALECYIGQQMR